MKQNELCRAVVRRCRGRQQDEPQQKCRNGYDEVQRRTIWRWPGLR